MDLYNEVTPLRSHRLKDEVIFLETKSERFQLSISRAQKKPVQIFEKYTWAKVKNASSFDTSAMIKGERLEHFEVKQG